MPQMKMWKGVRTGRKHKVWHSFVAALRNFSIVGGSVCVESGSDYVEK